MQLPNVPIPTPGNWSRFAWSGHVDPGDTLAPIRLGRRSSTVTVSTTSTPAGARVRFQHSPDGKRGWTDLDSPPTAFFKNRPNDTVEFRGLSGFIRPVLETKNAGPIAISVTVAPQEPNRMAGAAA